VDGLLRWGHRILGPEGGHAAGLALLAALYREETGEVLPTILTTPRGKPYFADGKLHFSVTHTKHHVFCALSDREIGIDAEETDRKIDLRLAEKILSDAENREYAEAADKRLALLRFWVLKEAHLKCVGTGLTGYPNQTAFSLHDPRVQETNGCLLAVIEKEEHHAL
jgi:phosphopantetheinyl transferase